MSDEDKKSITLWEKFSIYLTFMTLALSVINVYFTLELQSDAVDIQKQQWEVSEDMQRLEEEVFRITNFNTTIEGEEDFIRLTSYHFHPNPQNFTYVDLRGNLSATFFVTSPHVGKLEIRVVNYTRPYQWVFQPGYEQYSEVKFVHQPEPILLSEGATITKVEIPLACSLYPHPDVVPEPGKFEHFIFGDILFEVKFIDRQTGEETIHTFPSEIIGRIEMPEEG